MGEDADPHAAQLAAAGDGSRIWLCVPLNICAAPLCEHMLANIKEAHSRTLLALPDRRAGTLPCCAEGKSCRQLGPATATQPDCGCRAAARRSSGLRRAGQGSRQLAHRAH